MHGSAFQMNKAPATLQAATNSAWPLLTASLSSLFRVTQTPMRQQGSTVAIEVSDLKWVQKVGPR
jgi:hypothetical protein